MVKGEAGREMVHKHNYVEAAVMAVALDWCLQC